MTIQSGGSGTESDNKIEIIKAQRNAHLSLVAVVGIFVLLTVAVIVSGTLLIDGGPSRGRCTISEDLDTAIARAKHASRQLEDAVAKAQRHASAIGSTASADGTVAGKGSDGSPNTKIGNQN